MSNGNQQTDSGVYKEISFLLFYHLHASEKKEIYMDNFKVDVMYV